MSLTTDQQEQAGHQDKADSLQHGIVAADAFMAVFGFRRVAQNPESAQAGNDGPMTEGWDD